MTHQSLAILALDTAGNSCSVALWRGGAVAAQDFEAMPRGQSERLFPMISGVLEAANLGFADLDGLAVTVGPGAFTGVRIGLAAARGLALARSLPLFGATSFEVAAFAVPEEVRAGRLLAVALDSKRADLYVQAFGHAAPPPAALRPESLDAYLPEGALLLTGSGLDQARPALAAAGRDVTAWTACEPAATALVRLAVSQGLPESGADRPAPLYLRPPDVTLPKAPRADRN